MNTLNFHFLIIKPEITLAYKKIPNKIYHAIPFRLVDVLINNTLQKRILCIGQTAKGNYVLDLVDPDQYIFVKNASPEYCIEFLCEALCWKHICYNSSLTDFINKAYTSNQYKKYAFIQENTSKHIPGNDYQLRYGYCDIHEADMFLFHAKQSSWSEKDIVITRCFQSQIHSEWIAYPDSKIIKDDKLGFSVLTGIMDFRETHCEKLISIFSLIKDRIFNDYIVKEDFEDSYLIDFMPCKEELSNVEKLVYAIKSLVDNSSEIPKALGALI